MPRSPHKKSCSPSTRKKGWIIVLTITHHEFIVLIDTIETYSSTSTISVIPTFVMQMLHNMQTAGTCTNPANPTKEKLTTAHKKVCDKFLATLMLSGANRDQYGALHIELANQYGFGNNLYPKINRSVFDDDELMQGQCPPHTPSSPSPPTITTYHHETGRKKPCLCTTKL